MTEKGANKGLFITIGIALTILIVVGVVYWRNKRLLNRTADKDPGRTAGAQTARATGASDGSMTQG